MPESLKDLLLREREEVRSRHAAGALGGQIASALTDLADRVIVAAWRQAVEELPTDARPRMLKEMALVAVGGYGRGDLAPHSDIDLLFLVTPRPHASVQGVVNALVRTLWDVGLKLSQSVRTPAECLSFARHDLPHRTALVETRFLVGNQALLVDLQRRLHRFHLGAPIGRYIDALLGERRKEHQDYFATASLLEPNVKKSPGGLRDFHLLRWIALPRYGTRDPQMLRVGGVLTAEDVDALSRACEFLSRIRNELHFHAGTAQDVLTRDEQVRIATWLGYETQGALLFMERFMQQYYRHTTALQDLGMRFADGARRGNVVGRLLNRFLVKRVERHFLLDRDSIAIDPGTSSGTLKRADVLLELFDLARVHGVAVAHETFERVRGAVPACEITEEARRRFLAVVARPRGLGLLVRNLHRVGLLGRFIPAFEHARCLMQFNQYHKYTVDEHSIRVLEAALFREDDKGPVGQAYREIRRKDVLHLACLLHDIGKGYEEDHSEVGKRIAEELSTLLGLGAHERHQLVFLVHKHLEMAHVATRRDISDVATLVSFVRAVGTADLLRMLYVLTVADTEGVAPGSLTSWKESLFTDLYRAALEELAGEAPEGDATRRRESIRHELEARLKAKFPADWLRTQLEAMPLGYLRKNPPETVAAHLEAQRKLDGKAVVVEVEYLPDPGISQVTVVTRDSLTPGLFAKITGALASERIDIVDAEIVTRADGIVVDAFRGVDLDYRKEPPAHRRAEVASAIEDVLLQRRTVEALFMARNQTVPGAPTHPTVIPTQVEWDAATSDRFTILEVFADDRPGLLYTIARTLFDLELSIASAKISTRLDQVADVFYVTDRAGAKVTDEARLAQVRSRLLDVIPSSQPAAARGFLP